VVVAVVQVALGVERVLGWLGVVQWYTDVCWDEVDVKRVTMRVLLGVQTCAGPTA
jgi:hypothetical protein